MTHKTQAKLPFAFGLLLILVLFTSFFSAYTLQKHAAFQTAGFDLGNYEQALGNTLRGKPLALTTMQGVSSNWAVHFEPILFLIVPLYALFRGPQTLLVIQTIVVAGGAIPIFLLARQTLQSEGAGLVFACVYLLFPALQGALVFDFHGLALASAFLSGALWFLANRRYRLLLVMLVLAMSCKENVSLSVFMLGGYIFFIQGRRRWGLTIGGLAALWFIMANFVIIPLASPTGENIHLDRYSQWGQNMGQVIKNLLLHPGEAARFMATGDRLYYWLRLTMPVAFTALLDPATLLMALPDLVINTLSTYPPTYQLDRFHYSSAIVPFVVVAGVNGLARLVRWTAPKFRHVRPGFLQTTLLAMILIVTLAYQSRFGHTPIGRYFEWPVMTPHHRRVKAMLAQIPPDAAVAAQNNLAAHLSGREWLFILPKRSHQDRAADYIAVDMSSPLYPYDFIETYCADIDQFLADPHYGLIFAEDGVLLFEKGTAATAVFEPGPPCLQ